MTHGPGKYDDVCTMAREKAGAETCLLIIGGGNRGDGFQCQTANPVKAAVVLPRVLREVAAQIEADVPVRAKLEIPADALQGEWEEIVEQGVDMDALVERQERIEKPYSWYRLVIGTERVWIESRPGYCNRGRFHGDYDGTFHIDGADGFPRYFMDLERAKVEMREWLVWRIECERSR